MRLLKKNITLIMTAAVILLMSPAVYGALRTVNVMGQSFYLYDVKKGDTMFGIAHDYGWNRDVLESWNPSEISPLKKGSLIYYPCDDSQTVKETKERKTQEISAENIDREVLHKINKGETLYGLSRLYNVSVEALIRKNPGISEHNFKAGETIKIPVSGTGLKIVSQNVREERLTGFNTYKAHKEDTWSSIAMNHGISEEVLKEANKGTELKKNVYVGIPVIRMVEVTRDVVEEDSRATTLDGIREIYADVHGMGTGDDHQLRLAVVADDPTSRKDREFLRGVLLALDNLKNTGARISMKVVDGSGDGSAAVNELNSFSPSLVISTSEKDLPVWLTDYASSSEVNVVNTLDVWNEKYIENPHIIQLITPSDAFNGNTASWIRDNYPGYTLVFTGKEDRDDALASCLKDIWEPSKVRSRTIEDLRNMPLAKNGKYIIYSYPTSKNEVSEFLNVVEEATMKEPLAEVTVIGRPNWIVYDDVMDKKFQNNNVLIPARFYMNTKSADAMTFIADYRQMFSNAVPDTFPVYAGVGYDVTEYFMRGLKAANGDINALGRSRDTLQSDYELERLNSWSGLINNTVYMVRFRPGDIIDKILVK